MEIPKFIEDEDTYEINLVEWLRMVKEHCKTPFWEFLKCDDESFKWWYILDEYTIRNATWEIFEKLFSNKWIEDT
jgi:hypothetical protein